MKPERWNKIESIFHKALEAEEPARATGGPYNSTFETPLSRKPSGVTWWRWLVGAFPEG